MVMAFLDPPQRTSARLVCRSWTALLDSMRNSIIITPPPPPTLPEPSSSRDLKKESGGGVVGREDDARKSCGAEGEANKPGTASKDLF